MKTLVIAVVISVYLIGVASGFLFFAPSNENNNETLKKNEDVTRLRTGNTKDISVEKALYTNEKHLFSLEYPKELAVKEFDEGGDSITVVFQKPGEEYGFQIFVTPYGGDQITESRIRTDIKGGVEDLVEILVGKDNVRALAFLTENQILGQTREVWFIKNGYLFEFTTYVHLDGWLSGILSTLDFK